MPCVTGKRSYETEEQALEALLGTRVRFGSGGPVNFYACNDCGAFHLTSRGEEHPALLNPETLQRIKLEREAENWERKLR